MKTLSIVFTGALIALALLSTSSFGQAAATPAGEKVAIVLGKYNSKTMTTELTGIVPASKILRANIGKSMVESRARIGAKNITIDLSGAMPLRSKKLSVLTAISLKDDSSGIALVLKPGIYDIDLKATTNGTIVLAYSLNGHDSDPGKPGHHWLRTYCVDCCTWPAGK